MAGDRWSGHSGPCPLGRGSGVDRYDPLFNTRLPSTAHAPGITIRMGQMLWWGWGVGLSVTQWLWESDRWEWQVGRVTYILAQMWRNGAPNAPETPFFGLLRGKKNFSTACVYTQNARIVVENSSVGDKHEKKFRPPLTRSANRPLAAGTGPKGGERTAGAEQPQRSQGPPRDTSASLSCSLVWSMASSSACCRCVLIVVSCGRTGGTM